MEYKEYVKGKRVIRATETAYKAIYEAQGFVPRTEGKGDGGGKNDNEGGSGGGDNGEGASSGKPKKSKQ